MASKRGLQAVPPAGTKVRLTGYFLKSTGQQRGSEGLSRWTVQACACDLCKTGRFVCTDERFEDSYRTIMWGDLPLAERPEFRHIACGNLEIVGGKPKAADQSDEVKP